MRYNRASLQSTATAARKLAATDGRPRYVVATAYGYTIQDRPADFGRRCLRVAAGRVEVIGDK